MATKRSTKLIRLDSAVDIEIAAYAHRFEIVEASSAAAKINVAIQNENQLLQDSNLFEEGTVEEFIFQVNAVRVTASAQAGEWVKLRYTNMKGNEPANYKFTKREKVSVNEITKPVITQGGSNVDNGAVSLNSSTALKILSADTDTTGWLIQNPSTNTDTVYIGAVGVTAADGIELLPGAVMPADWGGAIYGISGTGTPSVRFMRGKAV